MSPIRRSPRTAVSTGRPRTTTSIDVRPSRLTGSLFRAVPAAVIAAAAFGASATSAQAAVPCFKNYGAGWTVQNDGSLSGSLQDNGSAGDENHGALSVAGVDYPKADGNLCAQTASAMTLPTRNLGGLTVSRSVSETGGKLRWLDTITNPGAGKVVAVDFDLQVLASQVLIESESGNNSADEQDHWTVHKSQSLYSLHQWGQDDASAQPEVLPEDLSGQWEHDFGDMDDDATLKYQFWIGGGQTVRLLHAIGTAGSEQAAVNSAKDAAGLFAGYSKSVAQQVVNFSDDPDGDGVNKFSDACPSVFAKTGNGCPQLIIPVPPADPVDPEQPQGGDQPAGDGTGSGSGADQGAGNGGTSGTASTPAPPASAPADKTGPSITIGRIGTKIKRTKLTTGTGTKASVDCNEDCRFTAKLTVKQRGRKQAKTIQRFTQGAFSADARVVKLRVRSPKLQRLAKQQVTLVVEATDRAGNRSTLSQAIKLK